MTESVKGRSKNEAKSIFQRFTRMLAQTQPDSSSPTDDLSVLAVVREFPSRINCATLAWQTLEQALDKA